MIVCSGFDLPIARKKSMRKMFLAYLALGFINKDFS
jgi:hypothetical protein